MEEGRKISAKVVITIIKENFALEFVFPQYERIGKARGLVETVNDIFAADDEEVGESDCLPPAAFGM